MTSPGDTIDWRELDRRLEAASSGDDEDWKGLLAWLRDWVVSA